MTNPIQWPGSSRKAWRVVLIAALFFFYEFIQMNMLNTISDDMLKTFHLTAEALGFMSSFYFIANLIFLFIAGMLLDRYSTRRIMLISLGTCVIGTLVFSVAPSIGWIIFCRFLTGIGSAFCFLSVLRLISRWFPARRMALATGVVVTMAMVGGMVAQTPFSILTEHLGWRHTLLIDALFGLLVWGAIALGVQDYPACTARQHAHEQAALDRLGYWASLRLTFLKPQNWLGGLFTSTINLPINVLGGLWGSMYLMSLHIPRVEAADISSMLFVGMIVGSPISGWLSDIWGRRKPLMILGALLALGCIWLLQMGGAHPALWYYIIFFCIGLVTSAQIIGYPLVSESNSHVVTAMAVSIVNISTISGIGFIQWLFGDILQREAQMHMGRHTGVVYSATDFHAAMWIFMVGMGIALVCALLVRETYGKQLEE